MKSRRSPNIAIIGTGSTRFGELFDHSYDDLVRQAVSLAIADAKISMDDIEAAWLSTAFPEIGVFKGRSGMDLAEPLSLYDIPVTRVSNFCASGGDAIRNAVNSLLAGECDVAMAVGVEKLRDRSPQDSIVKMMVEYTHPYIQKGFTAAGTFAVYANKHFEKYGVMKEDLAQISVKNHHNGVANPNAHHRRDFSVEQVLGSPMVAEPLTVMDCCPTTDGAACVIMIRGEDVNKTKDDPAYIRGLGLNIATGWDLPFFDPNYEFLSFQATKNAAKSAYQQAGVTDPLSQIDLAEVHDCFSIVELLTYEDLGFCKAGEAKDMVRGGSTTAEGEIPVNVSGGLLSCGHPVGATGVRMVTEIADQVRNRSGNRQVDGAKLGLAHNIGGPGAISSVIIIGNEN